MYTLDQMRSDLDRGLNPITFKEVVVFILLWLIVLFAIWTIFSPTTETQSSIYQNTSPDDLPDYGMPMIGH